MTDRFGDAKSTGATGPLTLKGFQLAQLTQSTGLS
jgi:hypothetical protein